MDDQIRPRNILCPLSKHHRDPQLPDSLQGLGFVVVRPGEIISPAVEDLRQGIHTGAPDSDKVYVTGMVEINLIHKNPFLVGYVPLPNTILLT